MSSLPQPVLDLGLTVPTPEDRSLHCGKLTCESLYKKENPSDHSSSLLFEDKLMPSWPCSFTVMLFYRPSHLSDATLQMINFPHNHSFRKHYHPFTIILTELCHTKKVATLSLTFYFAFLHFVCRLKTYTEIYQTE